MNRFRSWLRVVLPAEIAILAVLVLAALLYGFAWSGAEFGDFNDSEAALGWLHFLLIIAAVLFAVFRVVYFSPVENRPYGTWLATTRWRYPQPLPLGPLHLVWQDVLIVGLLTLLLPTVWISRWTIPNLFLCVYSLSLTYTICRAGIFWPVYAMAFLCGCLILTLVSPWPRAAVPIAMYAVAFYGRRELLERFPFTKQQRDWLRLSPDVDRRFESSAALGWPVPPNPVEQWSWSISHANAALIGATVGWLLFCIGFHFRDLPDFQDTLHGYLSAIVMVSVVSRVAIYVAGYVPPISLLGRITTGRLIIPKYDVVLAAPIAVVATTMLVVVTADRINVPNWIAVPVAGGLAVWLALALPPRREDWHLTGHHRIAHRFLAMLINRNSAKERV